VDLGKIKASHLTILGEGRRRSNLQVALESNFLKPNFDVGVIRLFSPSLTSLPNLVSFGI